MRTDRLQARHPLRHPRNASRLIVIVDRGQVTAAIIATSDRYLQHEFVAGVLLVRVIGAAED